MTDRIESIEPDESQAVGRLPPLPRLELRSRTRSEVRRLRVIAIVIGIAWLGALLAKTGLRADHHEISPVYAYGLPILMYVSGMLMLGLAVSRGRSGAGPRSRWVRLSIALLPVLFVLSSLWIEVGAHSRVPADVKSLWSANAACGALTTALGAVPFAVAIFALRHAFPVHAAGRGALVGLCSGLAAAATIHLHCSVADTSHILLSHGGPLVLLTVIGAWLGNRFLRT